MQDHEREFMQVCLPIVGASYRYLQHKEPSLRRGSMKLLGGIVARLGEDALSSLNPELTKLQKSLILQAADVKPAKRK